MWELLLRSKAGALDRELKIMKTAVGFLDHVLAPRVRMVSLLGML